MSREAKIFTEKRECIEQRIKEYECFGWELLSISREEVAMSRETQNKVYPELVKLEFEYEMLREQRDKLVKPSNPEPFSLILFFLCTLVLILPGILYLILCNQYHKKYMMDLAEYEKSHEELSIKIRNIVQTAKVNFFGRQST